MNTPGGVHGFTAIAAAVVFVVTAAGPWMPVHAEAQVTDKWITIVMPAEPPSLDGCDSSRAFQGRVVKQNIVETFVEKSAADGALKPRLAVSWEQTEPTTWRFKLRQGVTFHDGSPFNAAAVKRSIDRTLGKALVCSDKNKGFSDLTLEVVPVDDYTVDIKTPRPEPILPMRLASTSIVGPNTALDKLSLAPVGTGPYTFDSWQAGQQILLKRNDKYWGAKPQVEGVRYIWRDVSSVRASMVAVGEADIGLVIASQEATDPKLDFSHLNSETTYLRPDVTMAPMNDRRVRLAMNYAVDRQAMLGTIMPKTAVLAAQIVMPSIPGHNYDLDKRQFPYAPEKARKLLAEAKADGVPVDTEITFVVYPAHFPNAAELMEALFTQFKAVGFNMKILSVEPGQYAKWSNKPFAESRAPAVLQSSHDNSYGDPVFSVVHKFGCEGASSTLCDPEFDKQILAASTVGGEARVKAWNEVFRALYEDITPVVFLYHMVGFTRVNPRIDFVPDVTTNGEIRVQEIKFK